ncbi:hypothetical protein [Clostridium sp. UBA1652]|nr:hypothetical protein [Clostridium sp. UBA1652]
MSNEKELKVVILRVKDKYLKCNDLNLKKLMGKIIAGDISINNRNM